MLFDLYGFVGLCAGLKVIYGILKLHNSSGLSEPRPMQETLYCCKCKFSYDNSSSE
jgi:hypothetical protein